jgi:hypothetical protein
VEREAILALAFGMLWIFAGLAALDGLYLHLWKYQLHVRPESAAEHRLHTTRAVLFVPILVLLFARDFGGPAGATIRSIPILEGEET